MHDEEKPQSPPTDMCRKLLPVSQHAKGVMVPDDQPQASSMARDLSQNPTNPSSLWSAVVVRRCAGQADRIMDLFSCTDGRACH